MSGPAPLYFRPIMLCSSSGCGTLGRLTPGRRTLLVLAALVPAGVAAAARPAAAQAAARPPVVPPAANSPADSARGAAAIPARSGAGAGGWEVAPYVGYGARSPSHFWGLTPGRNHLMLGVQFVHSAGREGGVTVAYAPNVVPLFVLTNNPLSEPAPVTTVQRRAQAQRAAAGCESTRCGPVYGVAAAPLGLRIEGRPFPGLRVYGAAAAGVVWFSRNVPVHDARRLNATAEWGGGVVVGARAPVAAQVGFKYHHLSNAYTAARNPGVDGRVFYAGLLWRVGAGHARHREAATRQAAARR